MSKRDFQTATDGSTVTFDFDQSKNWQVTLGGNRSAVLAGGQEGDVVTILVIQDSTGNRTLSWSSSVVWNAGAAPSLKTAANEIDAITFVKRGSTWREISGGSPSRLPTRVQAAGLVTMLVVGLGAGGMVGSRVNLSAGTGSTSEIGRVPDVKRIYAGTGADATMTIRETGSGDYLLTASGGNAGGLGVGILNLKSTSKITDANWYVNKEGEMVGSGSTVRGTLSGAKLTINGRGASQSGKIVIFGEDGGGACYRDTDNAGWTVCGFLNGAQTCTIANATTCP